MILLLAIMIAIFGICRIMYDFWLLLDNGCDDVEWYEDDDWEDN